ncbi:MAG: hypothetical protein U0893_07755 [Chloroflexota bacterium]
MKSPRHILGYRTMSRATILATLSLVTIVAVVGCQIGIGPVIRPAAAPEMRTAPAPADGAQRAAGASEAAAKAQPAPYTAKLQFAPPHAQVGATVQIQGSGYPAGSDVELVWYTAEGRYELEGGTEFVGQRTDERSSVLTTLKADASGSISTKIAVPLDFGGSHDVRGRVNGQEISQASLTIDPTFSMEPREGPIGTPVELKIVGVDSRPNINTWHVLYDNHYFGFMSAVTTHGVAVARFRAAGPVGSRLISVWHNSFFGIPYLNWQQGPFKDVPSAEFTFKVTSDPGVLPIAVENFSAADNPWPLPVNPSGALSFSVDRGTVGQPTTLAGSNLPANTTLKLRWWTMIGNRVSGTGFSDASTDLGEVVTGADGRFSKAMTIPDDLGGQHRMEVLAGDEVVGAAGLVIQPSVLSISSTRVRAGEQVAIHLKGLGWTTYENTYATTYDNSYIGYVCGFSTNGDVQFTVTATGQPGTHLIDLYPTIYKGKDLQPRIYSMPQLTYATDHPQRITPAMQIAIEIVD